MRRPSTPAPLTPHESVLPTDVDVCILGAGASGLMCARTAARRVRRVLLLDHGPRAGRKLAISGGGKSNFTNIFMGIEHYISDDPTFCEPALSAFPPRQIQRILTAHRLAWEEREHGQLFGVDSAKTLVKALLDDALRAGVRLSCASTLRSLDNDPNGFSLTLERTDRLPHTVHSTALVLATGSPAWPQCGASDTGAQWARQLGHRPLPFRAVLTPLCMPTHWPLQGLAGISLPVTASTCGYQCSDALLFTHNGISGPAALQVSCHWADGAPVQLDFMPHMPLGPLLDAPECGRLLVRTLVARHIPQRLADALLPPELARRKIAELSRAARTILCQAVHQHTVTPLRTAGLHKAEAAAGGIPTTEVNAWSMESLHCPGLYIIGELLNVTGQLGGYNLHWAWASGHLAGQHV